MAWHKVSTEIDLSIPFIHKVNAAGKAVCLVNTGGRLFAVAATCPHAGADLSKGWCDQGNLICPFHRYAYDLETGRGAPGQNDFIRNYRVESRSDGVYVEIGSWLETLKGAFKG